MVYNLQFEKLCNSLQLGKLVSKPRELSGGLMHRMFALETDKMYFAVKALNPQVMVRPKVVQNIEESESIARMASRNIRAVPVKIFGGKAIQEIDGQYYLVFDWCGGKSIYGGDITPAHCEEIGRMLAKIHKTDFSSLGLIEYPKSGKSVPDWNGYLEKGSAENAPWVHLIRENVDKLYDYSNRVCSEAKNFFGKTVISHCDLDPKNVLWKDSVPHCIDWEAAGFINPMQDLLETAVYWAKDSGGQLEKDKFFAFFCGYRSIIPGHQTDWGAILDKGFSGLLEWLEYSLRRSLWIECADEAEKQMGTEQVAETIGSINSYEENRMLLADWLKEVG